jgi:hypothetical protein
MNEECIEAYEKHSDEEASSGPLEALNRYGTGPLPPGLLREAVGC